MPGGRNERGGVRECSQAEGNELREWALYRFSVRRRDPIAKGSECGLMILYLFPLSRVAERPIDQAKISPFSCDGP